MNGERLKAALAAILTGLLVMGAGEVASGGTAIAGYGE